MLMPRLSRDRDELLREPDRVLDPVLGHDYVVLDADPEAALEVDAGLDGDDGACRERVGALAREPRRLVDVEPEAVSEPVAERARESARLDHVARGRIDIDAARAGPDRVEPRLLGRADDVVRLPHLGVELSGRERPGVVRLVTVDLAAGVDDDELALADHAIAGARVWPGAHGPGADDRLERLLFRALLVVQPCDVPGHVALATADA